MILYRIGGMAGRGAAFKTGFYAWPCLEAHQTGRYNSTVVPKNTPISHEELARRAEAARRMLGNCRICPRHCNVDRTEGQTGFCGVGDRAFVSSWGPHFGEEPPLTGQRGSGTVFFSGCNLGCLYCQNWSISHGREGAEVSDEELAGVMLKLQAAGCHNINLVTPTHQVPMILAALLRARQDGLHLPVVYNTGGYESAETLELLHGIVDIYMPDLKYSDGPVAGELSDAPDYPEVARAALRQMHRQVGDLVVDSGAVARRGLIVRHLVLPGGLAGTEEVMGFIAREISTNTYLNIMDQYHPCHHAHKRPPLGRRLTAREFQAALRAASAASLTRLAR